MTTTTGPDRWEELGSALIQRRTALSPRFHNRGAFCEATGLKYRLVYDIEEHRRTNFGSSTLAAIEAAYRLEPGSIARFLAGVPLKLLTAVNPAELRFGLEDFPEATDEMTQAMRPHLEEIRMRVEIATRRHPGEPLTGAMIFPASDMDATTWDLVASAGWAPAAIPLAMAALLSWRAEASGNESGTATGLSVPVLRALW